MSNADTSNLKTLSWCAKCGRRRESSLHTHKTGNYNIHEFEPCVTLKDAVEFTTLKMLEVAKQKDEQWKNVFKERDARLAKELERVAVLEDFQEFNDRLSKVIEELRKK